MAGACDRRGASTRRPSSSGARQTFLPARRAPRVRRLCEGRAAPASSPHLQRTDRVRVRVPLRKVPARRRERVGRKLPSTDTGALCARPSPSPRARRTMAGVAAPRESRELAQHRHPAERTPESEKVGALGRDGSGETPEGRDARFRRACPAPTPQLLRTRRRSPEALRDGRPRRRAHPVPKAGPAPTSAAERTNGAMKKRARRDGPARDDASASAGELAQRRHRSRAAPGWPERWSRSTMAGDEGDGPTKNSEKQGPARHVMRERAHARLGVNEPRVAVAQVRRERVRRAARKERPQGSLFAHAQRLQKSSRWTESALLGHYKRSGKRLPHRAVVTPGRSRAPGPPGLRPSSMRAAQAGRVACVHADVRTRNRLRCERRPDPPLAAELCCCARCGPSTTHAVL